MRVHIVNVRPVASLTPGRIGQTDSLVNFQVEGVGSDFVVIPHASPDEKTVQAAIAARVKERHPTEGQSFEV